MLIVPQTRIHSFKHENFWHLDCKSLLRNISSVLYEPKCFQTGRRGDFLRWIGCPVGGYCIDETQPEKLIAGSQFTLRVDEPVTSEFWYIVFVSCRLDDKCEWIETDHKDELEYDIKLTNGHPLLNVDVLTKEFSFEEQVKLKISGF